MTWWQWLLSFEAPRNASLQSAALSLRGLFPWWAAVILLAVAAGGVIYLYTRESGRIGLGRRVLMAGLRIAAVALVVALLLRPVVVAEYRGDRPRGIALLLDNSQSMSLRDKRLSPHDQMRVAIANDLLPPDQMVAATASVANVPAKTPKDPTRVDIVRDVLKNPRLRLLKQLEQKGPVRTYLFGQRLHGLETTSAKPTSVDMQQSVILTASESRTALADAIYDVLLHHEGDLPAAIVVMTDGRDNSSRRSLDDVAAECRRQKVPLHIYGVGSSSGGLLQIKDLAVADTLFYDDTVSVPVRWQIQGFMKPELELTLRLGDKLLVRREATPREMALQKANLTFVPHKGHGADEKADLVASVQLKGSADFRDSLKRPVHLVDRRVRVLYIESSPRWEYKFLQSTLLRDRRVEPHFLLTEADAGVRKSGPPFLPAFPSRDQLFAYDLLILGDVPATYLGTEHMEWIRDFVNEGGGVAMIAGRGHAPASFSDTVLAEVLPVEVRPVPFSSGMEHRPELFTPVLSDAGQRSDMMALKDNRDDNLRTWKELPGFSWYYPALKLRPGAVAYLTHPRQHLPNSSQAMPVLAVQFYGRGESLFLASDETWRWRYNAGDRYFSRFWGQVVYRLGLPHLLGNARRVQLALERSEMTLGRPASVYARLFDREFRPWQAERVPARLTRLDAPGQTKPSRQIMLEAVTGQPGEYRAMLANDTPGRFELRVESPVTTTLPYRVALPPRHELEPLGMAEDELREAARLSGGAFYREEDLHALPSRIVPARASYTLRQEILLWNPLALVIFVGLVTVEWTVRKFSNLS